MPSRPGAIVRIIYYILELNDKVSSWFEEGFIVQQYEALKKNNSHSDKIKCMIKRYKKHDGKDDIKTLADPALLRQWLDKHTKTKKVYWFKRSIRGFKFNSELTERIRGEETACA